MSAVVVAPASWSVSAVSSDRRRAASTLPVVSGVMSMIPSTSLWRLATGE
jgi:hypothetical protein